MIAGQTQPLDAGAFARLMAPFEPFETSPVLAVAVSGGRDSLALALLSHGWAAERDGRVVGLIVDHGLRAESAVEAAATKDVLARYGIEGAILTWSGAKPRAGLQEAARMARYRLLRDECRRRGVLHLLLAHHADDQAETVAMRLARRSGPDGLAGMAALVDQPEAAPAAPLARRIAGPAHRHACRARRAVAGRSLECRSALRTGAAAGKRVPCARELRRRRRRAVGP